MTNRGKKINDDNLGSNELEIKSRIGWEVKESGTLSVSTDSKINVEGVFSLTTFM